MKKIISMLAVLLILMTSVVLATSSYSSSSSSSYSYSSSGSVYAYTYCFIKTIGNAMANVFSFASANGTTSSCLLP